MTSHSSLNRSRHIQAVSLLVAAVFATLSFQQVQAQPARSHVYLPPTCGATVLSTYIDSQARYILASGDYLESVAIAR